MYVRNVWNLSPHDALNSRRAEPFFDVISYLLWGGRGYCHVIICFVGHLINRPLSYVKPLCPVYRSPATVVFHSTCIARRVLSSLNLRNAEL